MIVVLGTINVDLLTVVPRFPGPGEEVKGDEYRLAPGGKGANQALAATLAGARVALVGCVGRDAFAEEALAGLVDAGVDLSGVTRIEGATGAHMVAVGPKGENMMIGADGANRQASARPVARLLGPDDTLLVQNSLAVATVEAAIATAAAVGARVVYNAAPAVAVSETTLAACDVIIVNQHEARGYAALFDLAPDFRAFARAAAARFDAVVVVTLGGDGLIAARPDGSGLAARPPAGPVLDTTGAGDALCGALTAALDRGDGLETALLQGIAGGSLACRQTGAQSSLATLDAIRSIAEGLELETA